MNFNFKFISKVHFKELTLFFFWSIKKGIFIVISFYFGIVFKRFFLSRGGKYPDSIKKITCRKYNINKRPKNEKQTSYADLCNSYNSIFIAGLRYRVHKNKIEWNAIFKDPEVEESLHRWGWAIEKLSLAQGENKDDLVSWVFLQQNDWINRFQDEINETSVNRSLRWESYTVSERVSNSIIFYHLTLKKSPSCKFSKSIQEQTHYLIHNLEYFGKNTGNHIINNARAIYLSGVFFDCCEWRELALTIIKREIPAIITIDGFMREGSSHYQFIFTRWLLEVYYFSLLNNDEIMKEFITPYVRNLIKQCHFFTIKKSSGGVNIPLFGDISPDSTPEWICTLPWSELAVSLLQPEFNLDSKGGHWKDLWSHINIRSENKESNCNSSLIVNYPSSGWFRGSINNLTVFIRSDKELIPSYVGHHHNDVYHFCLFYQGHPILIDSGRLNYNPDSRWSDFGVTERAHNSILIDGLGSVPRNNNLYPMGYKQANNRVHFVKKNESIAYSIYSSCFKRIHFNISVTREITLKKNQCIVEDIFIGSGEHQVESLFHWGCNVEVAPFSKNSWKIGLGAYTGVFEIINIDKFESIHYKGGESFLGWSVIEYGNKIPSSTLVFKGMVNFPASIKYKLTWEES